MLERLLEWDRDTLLFLNGLGVEQYDALWFTITKFPPWIPLFALIIFLVFWRHPFKQGALAMAVYVVMILLVSTAIFWTKQAVGRLRPSSDPEVNPLMRLLHTPSDFSFFSGHAAFSFSVAVMAVLLLRSRYKWIPLVLVWPLLFSYSRIYLGVHYPLDILVGALVGTSFAVFFYKLHGKLNPSYKK